MAPDHSKFVTLHSLMIIKLNASCSGRCRLRTPLLSKTFSNVEKLYHYLWQGMTQMNLPLLLC